MRRFAGVVGHGRAPETVRKYVAVVRRWLAFGGLPGHVDETVLLRFLASRRRVVSDASVVSEVRGLKAFYRVQVQLGEASESELLKLPKMRVPPVRMPRILGEDAVARLLTSLPLNDFLGLRDYAMIRLILETGLRSGEVHLMDVPDLLDGSLYVHALGRRGRDRYVPVSDDLRGVLDGYLHARSQRGAGRLRAFWLTAHNKRIRNARGVWEAVQRRMWASLGSRSGVADLQRAAQAGGWRGQYPHLLRATCAARWLANGLPLTAVAQLMGHADVSTTARYLGVDLEPLRAAIAHHPRALRQACD